MTISHRNLTCTSVLPANGNIKVRYCSSTMSRVLVSICSRENNRGMAHVSLVNIQPTYKRGVARVLLVCHAPFISDYSCASKCLLASIHDVGLERYCTS